MSVRHREPFTSKQYLSLPIYKLFYFRSTMTSSTEKAELRDLREQFQMQEDLLGHLKGVLKSNEDKLQMKDLEVEGYAMRLGKVRSRRSPGPYSVGDSRSSLGSFTGLAMDTQSESALEMFNRDPTSPG